MLFKTYCCDVLCGTSIINGVFVDVVKSVDAALKYYRVSDENVYVVILYGRVSFRLSFTVKAKRDGHISLYCIVVYCHHDYQH
jgi:hypothetical protein